MFESHSPPRHEPPGPAAPVAEAPAAGSTVFVVDARTYLRDSIVGAVRARRDGGDAFGFADAASCLEHCRAGGRPPALVMLSCHALKPLEAELSRLARLSGTDGGPRIVLLVDVLDADVLRACAQHRLDGVIPSSYSARQMLGCLDAILRGAQLLPIECLDAIGASSDHAGSTEHARSVRDALTRRQREVLDLVIEGRSNKYIAIELSLAESTVKVHVSELLRRLGATSRTHAAFLVHRAGARDGPSGKDADAS